MFSGINNLSCKLATLINRYYYILQPQTVILLCNFHWSVDTGRKSAAHNYATIDLLVRLQIVPAHSQYPLSRINVNHTLPRNGN